MSDLVTRLRDLTDHGEIGLRSSAADEIERLQSRLSDETIRADANMVALRRSELQNAEHLRRLDESSKAVAELQAEVDDSNETIRMLQENDREYQKLRKIQEARLCKHRNEISRLFGLLDDIDTAEDMFHPDDSPYFQFVHKRQRARFDGITKTDGYALTIDGEIVVERQTP